MTDLTWANAEEELVGKRTLVEVQHEDAMGRFQRHQHFHGAIVSIDRKTMRMELHGLEKGRNLVLPARLDSFLRAKPGLYRLTTTGEEIENPDWLCTFKLRHNDKVTV